MGLVSRARERIAAARRGAEMLPSPNIWHWPEVYEVENRAQDVDGAIWRVLAEQADWSGRDVVDIGCGSGFHLPRFASIARRVTGVEPHEPLVRLARTRVAALPTVAVLPGSAQRLPLPDASVDVAHARTAYFFGPGCEPGLAEAERVLRPGGVLAIVDLDVRHRPYGDWMRADLPEYDPVEVDRFFARMGFDSPDRRDAVAFRGPGEPGVRAADRVLVARRGPGRSGTSPGWSFPVGYRVLTRRKPTGLLVP